MHGLIFAQADCIWLTSVRAAQCPAPHDKNSFSCETLTRSDSWNSSPLACPRFVKDVDAVEVAQLEKLATGELMVTKIKPFPLMTCSSGALLP